MTPFGSFELQSTNIKKTIIPCCYLQYTSLVQQISDRKFPEISENLFLVVKSEIQICENLFLKNTKNRQSGKLNSREKFRATR